jgi:hypothetical protein
VIDGLRCYEAFHSTPYSDYVECMRDSLCEEGTLYPNVWNRGVTQTHGGHLSIATGTWQLMPNNLTYFGPEDSVISTQPDVPTFFEYFSKTYGYNPDSNKVFYFGGKVWKDTLACGVDPEYGREYGARVVIKNEQAGGPCGDRLTYETVKDTLEEYHPRLVLVNLRDVDEYAHKVDPQGDDLDSSYYYNAITTADSIVWDFWNWIQTDETYSGKTTLIVTTDHGRHDDNHGGFYHHGGICHGCRHIFLIAAGPDTPSDSVVTKHVDQIDICPTVGELLGFYYPKARGRPLTGMLTFSPSHLTGTNYGAGNDNVRVTDTDSLSLSPAIASSTDGDTLHVVYVDKSAGKFQVMYKRSTNLGAGWGDLDTLSAAAETDAQCPSLCLLGDTVDAVWAGCKWHQDVGAGWQADSVPRWYICHARSTDAGASWSAADTIRGSKYEGTNPRLNPSWTVWEPSIERYGTSTVGISVLYGIEPGKNRVGCFRSTNGGGGWTLGWLDDEAWFPRHADLAADTSGSTEWAFGTWYDLDAFSGNTCYWYIMFNLSDDGGATWLAYPVELYKDSTYVADPSVVADIRDGDEDLVVSWALWDETAGEWKIYRKHSTNMGVYWGTPCAISSASSDGSIDPELILSAIDGYLYDFWADYDLSASPVGSDIVYKYSTNGGATWVPQPPASLSDGDSYSLRPRACRREGVVWEDYRHGNWEIYFDDLP